MFVLRIHFDAGTGTGEVSLDPFYDSLSVFFNVCGDSDTRKIARAAHDLIHVINCFVIS
jgi:hypothetical protein